MHNSLRNALVIEMEDFLAEMEVLEQDRTARPYLQAVLVVGDWDTLLGSQHRILGTGNLVNLTAVTRHRLVFGDFLLNDLVVGPLGHVASPFLNATPTPLHAAGCIEMSRLNLD
jgi:hypothetical protein